jgi:thiamine phosphate synthase YjbQ (UPF0047 family)
MAKISSSDGLYIPLQYYAFLNNKKEQNKIKKLLPKNYTLIIDPSLNMKEQTRLDTIFKDVKKKSKKFYFYAAIKGLLLILILLTTSALLIIKEKNKTHKKELKNTLQLTKLLSLNANKVKQTNDAIHTTLAHILAQPLSIISLSISPINIDLSIVKKEKISTIKKLIAPLKAKVHEEEHAYTLSIEL